MIEINEKWLEETLLRRFIKYISIETTSNPQSSQIPSSEGQKQLAEILAEELRSIGLDDISIDSNCFLIARLPANDYTGKKCIGYIAHLDTTPDVSGKNVNPRLHRKYNGGDIPLNETYILSPEEFPQLSDFIGDTIITTDGTTLLGADDKAGITEIMTAVEFLNNHKEIPHPEIEIIFTPDEETGRGMEKFPLKQLHSQFCYTFDGDGDGIIEAECFEAYKVKLQFTGKSIHLGQARGKLINAITLASSFLTMLPAQESPEATDGQYGYYCPVEIKGDSVKTSISLLIRDFNPAECLRRIDVLKNIAGCIETIYPGSKIKVEVTKQYSNMKHFLPATAGGLKILEKAISLSGVEPQYKSIRGGTDGARLCEIGIPTPNVFAGGQNFHSIYEWLPLSAMVNAAKTAIHLANLWTQI